MGGAVRTIGGGGLGGGGGGVVGRGGLVGMAVGVGASRGGACMASSTTAGPASAQTLSTGEDAGGYPAMVEYCS